MEELLNKFFNSVQITEGCWLWTGDKHGGDNNLNMYGRLGKTGYAHRISYELFNGPISDKQLVLHTCDMRLCVNPDHLFLGTHLDNARDRKAKGRNRNQYGELNSNSKLTVEQVISLRSERDEGKRLLELAKAYGISYQAVSKIARREAYSRVH